MEDRKKYDFQGTVTISSEEYSDLVYASTLYKKEADDYRSKSWKLERERDEAKDANKAVLSQMQELQKRFDLNSKVIEEKDLQIANLQQTASLLDQHRQQIILFQEFVELDDDRLVKWNEFKRIKQQ